MPYANRERHAAQRTRRIERTKQVWAGEFTPPAEGRLIGRAFQAPVDLGAAAPDHGLVAAGRLRSRKELRDLLVTTFGERFSSACALRLEKQFDDWSYYAPTLAEIDRVVDKRAAQQTAYEPEIFDCEDFAYSLRTDFARVRYTDRAKDAAFAVGLIWGEFPQHLLHVANVAAIYNPEADRVDLWVIDSLPENFSRVIPRKWLIDAASWPVVDYIVI